MSQKYKFKQGARLHGDPQAIGEELERLEWPTAEGIVDAAKDKKNPLHNYFEWDDTEAAAEYRLQQAQYIGRNITVEIEVIGPKGPVVIEFRAFETVNTKTEEEGTEKNKQYVPVKAIFQNEDLLVQVKSRITSVLITASRQLKELAMLTGKYTKAEKHVEKALVEMKK